MHYIIHEAQGSGWFMNTVRLPNNLKMLTGPTFICSFFVNKYFRSFLLMTPVIFFRFLNGWKHGNWFLNMINRNIQGVKFKTFPSIGPWRGFKRCIPIDLQCLLSHVGNVLPSTIKLFVLGLKRIDDLRAGPTTFSKGARFTRALTGNRSCSFHAGPLGGSDICTRTCSEKILSGAVVICDKLQVARKWTFGKHFIFWSSSFDH